MDPLQPLYPEGTPEYADYRRKLLVELDKFSNFEPPYNLKDEK